MGSLRDRLLEVAHSAIRRSDAIPALGALQRRLHDDSRAERLPYVAQTFQDISASIGRLRRVLDETSGATAALKAVSRAINELPGGFCYDLPG
jgi:hypothetical protein